MATRRLGIDSKLYYRSAGTFGAPTWTEISLVSDLTESAGWNTTTAGDRATGIDTKVKTTATLGVSGKIRVSDDDTGYLAMLAGYLARDTPIDFMILNGAKTSNGVVGFRGLYHVSKWDESQGMQDVLYRDFMLDPAVTDSTAPHQSVVVSAGAPVFTTFAAP